MFTSVWNFINKKWVKLLGTSIVAVLGIYGTFLWERKADVSFEIVSNSSVLDVKESLNNLVITYRGTNLKEQNQTLYLVTVKVANVGNADILKTNYDPDAPLGIAISSGVIVESPSVIGDEYFVANVRPSVRNATAILFAPVILNSGDSFQIKALVLAKATEVPRVSAVGKLAGIKSVAISKPDSASAASSYWTAVFAGDLLVQFGRLVYVFIGLVFLSACSFAIGLPAVFIGNSIQQSTRKKKAQEFRASLNRATSLKEEYLLTQYIENTVIYRRFKRFLLGVPDGVRTNSLEEFEFAQAFEAADAALINAGLIVRDGPQVTVDPEIEPVARAFLIHIGELSQTESV